MKRFNENFENANINLVCGDITEEIKEQDMTQDVVGGWDSPKLGNSGGVCSATLECMNVCNWVNWSGWGFWC